MTCLGLNIYYWGRWQQNRLLVECLGPLVADLHDQGFIESFWFDRFDSRGPHLFVLLTLPPGVQDEAARIAADRLGGYLADHPSTEQLSAEQLARLHSETRGKALCTVDAFPGMADNNSLAFFAHDRQGYPFSLSAGLLNEPELWRLLDDLAQWAIRQIGEHGETSTVGAAVRWAAGLDAILEETGLAPEYWRFHATTLIMPLAERLATAEEEVLRSLPSTVGEKNRATFSRVWKSVATQGPGWPHMRRLVELAVFPDEDRPAAWRFRALREAVHCAWKQLGVPVQLHIPLVLFAWDRSLARIPVASPSGSAGS
jgi:hypothetical protein